MTNCVVDRKKERKGGGLFLGSVCTPSQTIILKTINNKYVSQEADLDLNLFVYKY